MGNARASGRAERAVTNKESWTTNVSLWTINHGYTVVSIMSGERRLCTLRGEFLENTGLDSSASSRGWLGDVVQHRTTRPS